MHSERSLSPVQAVSRRGFAVGGVTAAAMLLAGCSAHPADGPGKDADPAASTSSMTPSSTPSPSASTTGTDRLGYFMVLNQGRWVGPRSTSGAPTFELIDALLEQRPGTAMPNYLRVTSAAPSGANTPAAGSSELEALRRLTAAGVRLGVAIGTAPNRSVLSAADVVAHAKQVRGASEQLGGLYDWIFLDEAVEHTPAGGHGLNDLQSIVDQVAETGWSNIMINATGFTSSTYQHLPERTWAMARHFGLITPSSTTSAVAQVVSSHTGAVLPGDQQFASYVNQHRAGSTPVLKLEVPSTSSRFSALPVADQTALLTLWAQGETKDAYRTLYPLYLPGSQTGTGSATQYDSLTTGTFWQQRTLMQQYG